MRILAVSDTESTALWDHYNSNKITNTDLILSCGDLNPQYLSFLVSCTNLPLLYVHGNHDEKYDQTPPEGCICIDDKIYVHEGIRILGLGGCMPYKPGKYMYTEKEMKRRLLHIKHQLIFYRGFDILLTHAPAQGLGDGDDHAHQGYQTFLGLLDKYQPKYMVHDICICSMIIPCSALCSTITPRSSMRMRNTPGNISVSDKKLIS